MTTLKMILISIFVMVTSLKIGQHFGQIPFLLYLMFIVWLLITLDEKMFGKTEVPKMSTADSNIVVGSQGIANIHTFKY